MTCGEKEDKDSKVEWDRKELKDTVRPLRREKNNDGRQGHQPYYGEDKRAFHGSNVVRRIEQC